MTALFLSRRRMLAGASAVLLCGRALAAPGSAQQKLAALEFSVGGRLGVAALDVVGDRRVDFRSDHRWPMCSTFKLLLVGAVLAKVDDGHERLDRAVAFAAEDVLDYAPAAKRNLAQGHMSVAELCEAAIRLSDNTAANLLLKTVGGPGGFNAFVRTLGDHVTHLDRIEPFLNDVPEGDARDTTTPAAMLNDLGQLVLHDRLTAPSRRLLTDWLVGCETGKDRLRAGLPAGWRVGDKTGTWSGGATNDVAIAWPPGRGPLLVAAYLGYSPVPIAEQNKALAEAARIVAEELISGS
jgi:beta-lactamase class A